MITINKLSFNNVLCYGENNVFTFEDTVTQLIGKNGNGKSSLPTILEEALYNKNSRGIKKADLFNRYLDKKEYNIKVEFSVDSDEYILSKKVTASTKVILTKNGEDISGHTTTQTYKLVESILGLDFPSFTKLVYQSMVSSLDFLSSTDANRKKFLISLLGLDKYLDSEKVLKDAAKSALLEVSEAKGKVTAITKWLDNETLVQIPKEVEVPEVASTLEPEIQELKEELAKLEVTNKMITNNNKARDRAQNLQVLDEEYFTEEAKLEALQKSSREHKDRLGHHKTLLSTQKASVRDSVCPTCKTVLEDSSNAEAEIEILTKDIELTQAHIDDNESNIRVLLTKKMRAEKYARYLVTLREVNDSIDDTIPADLVDAASVKMLIGEKTKELSLQTRNRDLAVRQNSEATKAKTQLEYQLQQMEQKKEELETYKKEAEHAALAHHRVDVVAKAFGAKGLVAYKIESMVKVFEELINEYLQVLSEGRFALTFVVEDTKLALKLYDNANEIDIKSLSSGELNRVNTATLLAVRKMMSAISKVSLNVLFLDEVISVLDEDGKATLIDVLLRETLNTVVVSHGYAHPLAGKVEIIKEDNISRIE